MSKTTLTLVFPELATALVQSSLCSLPGLRHLLARARVIPCTVQDYESLLFSLFNIDLPQNLPIAAITALADGLPASTGFWLRADPVEFHADFNAVYLVGNQQLELTFQQCDILVKQINTFLADADLQFFLPHPQRGYLKLAQPPRLHTYPLSQVVGNNIYDYMPQGPHADYWRKLMTELQMLLFNNNFSNNQATVNGIWLWGEGTLPVKPNTQWQAVYSNEPISHGLASLAENYAGTTSMNFQNYFDCLEQVGDYLLVYTVPCILKNPHDQLLQLEQRWFLPLLTALRKKLIAEIKIYLGDGRGYQVTKADWWRF